jgi:hypothetical protein
MERNKFSRKKKGTLLSKGNFYFRVLAFTDSVGITTLIDNNNNNNNNKYRNNVLSNKNTLHASLIVICNIIIVLRDIYVLFLCITNSYHYQYSNKDKVVAV